MYVLVNVTISKFTKKLIIEHELIDLFSDYIITIALMYSHRFTN